MPLIKLFEILLLCVKLIGYNDDLYNGGAIQLLPDGYSEIIDVEFQDAGAYDSYYNFSLEGADYNVRVATVDNALYELQVPRLSDEVQTVDLAPYFMKLDWGNIWLEDQVIEVNGVTLHFTPRVGNLYINVSDLWLIVIPLIE